MGIITGPVHLIKYCNANLPSHFVTRSSDNLSNMKVVVCWGLLVEGRGLQKLCVGFRCGGDRVTKLMCGALDVEG